MKALLGLLVLGCALAAASARAQTTAAPPDAAQVAEYKKRFEAGFALEQQGKLTEARSVFDGILAEQPDALHSLLEAGRVSLRLNQPAKADAYLAKFHELQPDLPEGTELWIQTKEALQQDADAETLIREFRALHDSGTVPGFGKSLFFVRERVPLDHGTEAVIAQFFDYTQPPYYMLRAELFDAAHARTRLLLLKYDPEGTAALQAKNPGQTREVFLLAEPVLRDGQMKEIDVYEQILSPLDYRKIRNALLATLAHAPKPIYSAPVTDAAPHP